MTPSAAIRKVGLWLFGAVLVLAVLSIVVSNKHQPDILDQLRSECRARYATAHTRGDSILVDNWIPAQGLQGIRGVWHCSDLGFTYRVP